MVSTLVAGGESDDMLLLLRPTENNDIVPTLSLGILRDFKNISVTLSDEGSVTEEIVGMSEQSSFR